MKIQILGTPRSGTTCLYETLRDNINYSMGIFEPLNPDWNYKIPLNNLEPLTKRHINIINNIPLNVIEKNVIIDFSLKEEFNTHLNFYKNYLKNFDKVILLSRKNLEHQSLSCKIAVVSDNWHSPYTPFKIDYSDVLPIMKHKNDLISKLSIELNIPMFFYEDLYSNNISYLNNFLKHHNIKLDNYPQFYYKMNTKNRLRQL